MVDDNQNGFTIVELVIGVVALGIIAISMLGLFTALVNSALITKRRAVAVTLATNQMEYLKSLPFNSLAVVGGSFYSPSPLPATTTKTLNGVPYTIKTDIDYVDDAFDGCTTYPTQELKQVYCRNYPPPTGAPAVDSNPQDYKIINVTVFDKNNSKLAEVDTEVSARVSETASTTGALFIKVQDDNGNPVQGANVNVSNSTLSPAVNLNDLTDSNGMSIFYGLTPDTNGYDYVVSATNSGYSNLTTIAPSGTLQPNFPNQQIFTQLPSFVTLTINPQGANSIVVETTDVSGSPLANVKIYIKGGYKKYIASNNTSYYYDNMTPSDTRPTTSGGGFASISNLAPGPYIFCGDSGATSCSVGGTTYYLAAAVPYGGTNSFNPIIVPPYSPSSPPPVTFEYGDNHFLQKVRLMFTTNSSFPRVISMAPDDASLSSDVINSFAFQINGVNLPCSANAGSCATTVKFVQNGSNYVASCTGASTGLQLDCVVNLTGITAGNAYLVVAANGYTLTMPSSPMIGGINVTP